ncbi:hypothetical protein HGB13_01100 [bacterium]|nr:hypothetical protein [bacterium]
MKKITYILILCPQTLHAASVNDVFPGTIPKGTIEGFIAIIISALLGLSATIAVWFLIVGGFQYVTSAGNPDQVTKAKNTVLYAIIGLMVTIFSYAVVNFVINAF